MITMQVEQLMRNDFIEALIFFSNGAITEHEAMNIANQKLRLTDFTSEDSPVAHKGVRWLAACIVRNMGLYNPSFAQYDVN